MFYDFKVLEEFEHHLSYDNQRIGHEAENGLRDISEGVFR